MDKKQATIGFIILILLCSLASGAMTSNMTSNIADGFLSWVGIPTTSYYPSAAKTSWTYTLDNTILSTLGSWLGPVAYTDVDYTTGYAFVSDAQWTNSVESSLYTPYTDVDAFRARTLRDSILIKTGGVVSMTVTQPWVRATAQSKSYQFDLPSTSKFETGRLVVIACAYHAAPLDNKAACEIYVKRIGVYNLGGCGADVNLISKIEGQTTKIDAFFNNYGGEKMCARKGIEHGYCSTVTDCKGGMVSQVPQQLGTASLSNPAFTNTQGFRCEHNAPTDNAIAYVGGGTCEYGVKNVLDCEGSMGPVNQHYWVKPTGGTISASGWGLLNSQCILGHCSSDFDCVSIFGTQALDCNIITGSTGAARGCYRVKCGTSQAVCANSVDIVEGGGIVYGCASDGYCYKALKSEHPEFWEISRAICEAYNVGKQLGPNQAWYLDDAGKCVIKTALSCGTQSCTTAAQCTAYSGFTASCVSDPVLNLKCCDYTETGEVPPLLVCGDGKCQGTESYSNCPADCFCGNGVCEPGKGEDKFTCQRDCGDGPTPTPEPDIIWILVGLLVGLLFLGGVIGILYVVKKKRQGGGVLP